MNEHLARRQHVGNLAMKDGDRTGRARRSTCALAVCPSDSDLDDGQVDQRDRLEDLFEEEVARRDQCHLLSRAARQDRPGGVVGRQGIITVDVSPEPAAVARGLLEDLDRPFAAPAE